MHFSSRTVARGVLALAAIAIMFASHMLAGVPPVAALTGIINDDGVDVGDEWTLPGDDGTPGDPGSPGSGWWLGPYRPQIPRDLALAYCVARIIPPGWCAALMPTAPTPPEPELPDLTFADVAHVVPQSPTLITQPSGWSVVGVETNLIALIQTHIVTTRVFGREVDVRFTPIRYDWAYGDGVSGTTDVPGAKWSSLGVAEFARTPTSHRYSLAVAVTPHVDVTYAVDYRWADSSWRDIAGTLSRGDDAPVVFLQNADTVLVTGPCGPNGNAVGCG
jgi:hypothetical protein